MSQRFQYAAYDTAGRRVTGSVQAASAGDALSDLRGQQLDVVDLLAQPVAAPAGSLRARSGRIGIAERVVLLQELGTLLGAGVPMSEVAASLEQAYAATPLGRPLQRLAQQVRNGAPLGEALQLADPAMPPYALSLIAAGEAAGRVAESLRGAAEQLEQERQVGQQLRNALIYPSVLVLAGAAAVLIIFIAVVPRFASLIRSGRAEVPALSRWVIETGLALQSHWPVVAGVVAAAVMAGVAMLRSPAARQALLDAMARAPAVGPWLWRSEIGRWAGLLGTLLSHRVPLVDALALSSRGARLSALRHHLVRGQAELRRGRPLSDILQQQGWVDATRINLVRVGERTGELPRLLQELGRLYTDAAQQAQKRMLTLIEPLAILLIGSVIGVIMVAVVMAVTALNTARL